MPADPSPVPTIQHYTDRVNLGAVASVFPVATVRQVLVETGRESQRRRDLPAELMLYFVIAMALMFDESYREVLRRLLEGLRGWEALFPSKPPEGLQPHELRAWEVRQQVRVSGKSALYNARMRLGTEPLEALFDEVAKPLAQPDTVGCWYEGLRLVSFDGTTLNVWDSDVNAEAFGYPGASRGESAFPQVRLLTLVELGTHATLGAAFDGVRKCSENALARQLMGALKPGMLHLADRGFYGFGNFSQAADTGAQLLWRVKTGLDFECVRVLSDGSWLAHIYPSKRDREHQLGGRLVRIVEYCFDGIPDTEAQYRLMTTLLDPELYPARDLAILYHQRWEHESTFDEIKAHLLGARKILRSRRPELVAQEIWAILLAHYTIRTLMHEAAHQASLDPDVLSFMHTLRIVRRKLPSFAVFPPPDVAAFASRGHQRNPGRESGIQPGPTQSPRSSTENEQLQAKEAR